MTTDSEPGKNELKTNPDWYIARVDRLPAWGLSYALIWALGFSFFITLYDVINVGVALPVIPFITNSAEASMIAALGLFGYIPGAIGLSYLADIIGRKPTLIISAFLTTIGSFGDALATNYPILAVFRFLTGMGIGADLVLVMTYLAEMAPNSKRGLYVNLAYIGGWAGIGLGPFLGAVLVDTYPAIGWRLVFAVGGALALMALAIRATAPETVRFLAKAHKFDEAGRLVNRMEETSMRRANVNMLPEPQILNYTIHHKNPFSIFKNSKYLKRYLVLLALIFFWYFGEYPYLTLFTTWTKDVLGYTSSLEASAIFLFGLAGVASFLGSIGIRPLLERVDRRVLVTLANTGFVIGMAVAVLGGIYRSMPLFFSGMIIGNFIGVGWSNQLNYLLATENYPTYARATAYAMTDGLAHLGAAIAQLILLSSLIPLLGSFGGWMVIEFEMIIAGILTVLVIPKTLGRRLEEVNELEELETQNQLKE